MKFVNWKQWKEIDGKASAKLNINENSGTDNRKLRQKYAQKHNDT